MSSKDYFNDKYSDWYTKSYTAKRWYWVREPEMYQLFVRKHIFLNATLFQKVHEILNFQKISNVGGTKHLLVPSHGYGLGTK